MLALDPTTIAIVPDAAVPAVAPVESTALPDAPLVVDPDANVNDPLTPAVPASALRTLTSPDVLGDAPPEEKETTPPVLATDIPALIAI